MILPRAANFLPLRISSARFSSSQNPLPESVKSAVESKAYHQIPEILDASDPKNPNPFSFLSALSSTRILAVVDEILQSFIPIRPRSRLRLSYSHLLSHTLQSADPLPISLAVLQRTLRSGILPLPQIHLLLSDAWTRRLTGNQTPSAILSEMRSIGYTPDCNTCNYLIQSLGKLDRIGEAVRLLRAMARSGCPPDSDSFGVLISEMSELRSTSGVLEMVEEMVSRFGLNPRKEVIAKAAGAMRANRDVRKAIEMIEFLEERGVGVGFEAYEVVLDGCLENRRFVLAGKFVVRMTGRGFIPYIRARQRLVEGLVSVGEIEMASVVRRRFAELKS